MCRKNSYPEFFQQISETTHNSIASKKISILLLLYHLVQTDVML